MAVVMWGYVGAKMRDIWMRWRSMWWGKAGGGEGATATFFVRERQEVSGACALWGFVVHCFDSFAEISNAHIRGIAPLHLSFAYASSSFVPSDQM